MSGSSTDYSWPGTTIEAAAFSPDGAQLAMSVGVLLEGSETARNGHVYVLSADGSTHDVAATFLLFGWLPGSREVVVGLGDEGRVRAVGAAATADAPSRRLGPFVDAGGQGAVSMVSPDGLLVASALLSSSTQDSQSYSLRVTRIADGTTVRTVDYPDVYGVQVVGWTDATTPVVGVWAGNGTPGGSLVVVALGPEPIELSSGPSSGGVSRLAAAQEPPSTVRPAGPPVGLQWFKDARAAAWHVSGWFGMTSSGLRLALILVGLFLAAIAVVLLRDRRLRRRHSEA